MVGVRMSCTPWVKIFLYTGVIFLSISYAIQTYGLPKRSRLQIFAPNLVSKHTVDSKQVQSESLKKHLQIRHKKADGEVNSFPKLSSNLRSSTQESKGVKKSRMKKEQGVQPTDTLILYELYDSKSSWPNLLTEQPFRRLCVLPGNCQNESDVDISAASILPILNDFKYQSQLCEYSGMLAVDAHLPELQGSTPWIGFQSWNAKAKKMGLTGRAVNNLIMHLRVRGDAVDTKSFYFWSRWGIKDLYGNCQRDHKRCGTVLSNTFDRMFSNESEVENGVHWRELKELPNLLPPLPALESGEYSFCSYWAMHTDQYQRFMAFARMFFVTLETVWDLHSNARKCPLKLRKDFDNRKCWCFLLERIVNIWVYHTNTRMFLIDSRTGTLSEQLPVTNRTEVWTHWFGEAEFNAHLARFNVRLPQKMQRVYARLGGTNVQ